MKHQAKYVDWRRLAELMERDALTLPDASSQAAAVALAQLQLMGLQDAPEYPGVRSSVEQYALCAALPAGERQDLLFVTMHPGLLANADQLERLYGVRPISLEELQDSGAQRVRLP